MSSEPNTGAEKKDTTEQELPVSKKYKYTKDKPWDNDPTLDKWVIDEFKPEHNPHGM